MGRVSYQEMSSVWLTSDDDYAAPMNDVPKVVFSKTLERADWPVSTIARGALVDEVAALKALPGGELIVWGGASLAQSMTAAGLIDQYAIVTRSAAYGGEKPLFGALTNALNLRALATTVFESGHILRLFEPE